MTYSTFHWRMLGSARAFRARFPEAVAIEEQRAGGRTFWYWMLAASVVMVAAGAYLHRQENRAVLMWNFLDQGVEVGIGDLCDSLAVERGDLPKTLALINAQPHAHYVWDREADRIVDVRWTLFELQLYAVPVLFIVMVFAFTGPTRWALKEALSSSIGYKRVIVWSWVLMLLSWFLLLAVAAAGVAA